MRPLAFAVLAASLPAFAQQAPLGTVRSDRGAVEVLPPHPGASELRTPEGFIRVEGGVVGPGGGTFGVYQAGARVPPPAPVPVVAALPPQVGEAVPERCRPERSRYLRRLLYMAGIDLQDPIGFLEGLAGREGLSSALLFTSYGLLPGVDPIRPLAWDLELRSLARDLAACQGGDSSR